MDHVEVSISCERREPSDSIGKPLATELLLRANLEPTDGNLILLDEDGYTYTFSREKLERALRLLPGGSTNIVLPVIQPFPTMPTHPTWRFGDGTGSPPAQML